MSPNGKVFALVAVVVVLIGAFAWFMATRTGRMIFREQLVIDVPPDTARAALRAFAKESLADWTQRETPNGLTAHSVFGMHQTDATMTVEPEGTGATVTMELSVLRASNSGYMLVDAGSFYDRHLKKWLADVKSRAATPAK